MPGDAEARSLQLGFGKLGIEDGISASPAVSGEKERSSFRQASPSNGAVVLPLEKSLSPLTVAAPRQTSYTEEETRGCKSLISGSCGKASSLRNSLWHDYY